MAEDASVLMMPAVVNISSLMDALKEPLFCANTVDIVQEDGTCTRSIVSPSSWYCSYTQRGEKEQGQRGRTENVVEMERWEDVRRGRGEEGRVRVCMGVRLKRGEGDSRDEKQVSHKIFQIVEAADQT